MIELIQAVDELRRAVETLCRAQEGV